MFVFDREIVDNKLTCGDGRIEWTKRGGEGGSHGYSAAFQNVNNMAAKTV